MAKNEILTEKIINAETGEEVILEVSAEEIASREAQEAERKTLLDAKAAAREATIAKLAALGLTPEDLAAL